MHFCPTCANILLVEQGGHQDRLQFFCQTCPYVSIITQAVIQEVKLQRKQVDDILGGAEAWKNVPQTEGMIEVDLMTDDIVAVTRKHLL